MLNILWVEDNYQDENQKSWFSGRKFDLKTNFTDALNAINNNLNDYDLFVLDIDLENSEQNEIVNNYAKTFKKEPKEFLKESGIFLFLQLIEQGVSRDKIVFLTGNADTNISRVEKLRESAKEDNDELFEKVLTEIQRELGKTQRDEIEKFLEEDDIDGLCSYLKNYYNGLESPESKNTYNSFCTSFEKAFIEPPKAICKDLDVSESLNDWLVSHESNSYLVLRRGIIKGCRYLKMLTENELRFNHFIKEDKNVFLNIEDYLTTIKDYLSTLENFLPLREPTDSKTFYKLFIRTLAHEWEESVEPKELDTKGSFAFSWIMKMTRNWIAHNSTAIFTNLTEQDVAYLFMCNMRAMFDLGDSVQDYEKHLFSLFNADDAEDKIRNKDIPLINTYVTYFNESTNRTDVHNILHDLQNNKIKLKNKGDKFFITGLYHCFWFLTSSHDNKKDKANPNRNNANQVFISRYYTFEFFDYTKSDFLLTFSSHIYNRSFS